MAAQQIYYPEAIDVRLATQPDTSRRKIISSMAIPAIKQRTIESRPGGSILSRNLSLPMIEPIEPKYATEGFDLAAMRMIGLVAGAFDRWVFAGSLRVPRRGTVPFRAIIEGRVTNWEPDGDTSPGEMQKFNHVLHDVSHYEVTIDGEEMFYVDDEENIARSGGVDWFAPTRRSLGV